MGGGGPWGDETLSFHLCPQHQKLGLVMQTSLLDKKGVPIFVSSHSLQK